jgi:hypothetical protein
MTSLRYSVTPHPIDTPLTWVKSGETARCCSWWSVVA